MPLKSQSSFLNGSESLSWPILCKTDTHTVCMYNRVEWNINLSLQFYLTIYSNKTSFNASVVKTRLESHQILWCLPYTELLPTSVQLDLLTHFFISIKCKWYIVQATFVWSFGRNILEGVIRCTSIPALAWAASQTPRGCLGLRKICHQTPKLN